MMGRVKFDNTVNGNGDGTITGYDAESGTTATYNPNDPNAGRTNVTDAFTKRDRYRSLGEAAANTPAYQVNFGLAQGDAAQGLKARDQQMNAALLQGNAANGNAPSAAAIMGNQAGSQSIGAALGATAGAKTFATRGSPGMAAAQMQAQQGQGGMQQQAVGQYGSMRAGEIAQARGAYDNTLNAARAGDYQGMGMAQQQADAQAQSENAQRSLNQAGQMGFEQLGVNSEQQQVNSRLRQMQIQANANNTQATADAAREAMERQQAQGIISAAGAGLGQAGSDERMKQGSYMLSDAAAKREAYIIGVRDGSQPVGEPRFVQTFSRDNPDGTAKGTKTTHEPQLRQPVTFSRDDANGQATNVVTTHDPMTAQLAEGLAPHSYEYKPEFAAAEGQQPGEKNVGPMAQNMASNPVTGQAVSQRPDGLLQIDMKKATKLSLAAAGHNAQKIREQQAQIDALKGGR